MPKCGKPTKDGTPCSLNAMVGKDHCHLHPPEPEAAPRIEVVSDPVVQALEEILRLRKEEEFLIKKLMEMKGVREEIIEESREQLARDRHGLSEEDLDRATGSARLDFAQRRAREQQRVKFIQDEIRNAPRISYTPAWDDIIPYGGINWGFARGITHPYPRLVIEEYERKHNALAERDAFKRQLSARAASDEGMSFEELQAILDGNR
ncbi:MAG: hypothetical protein GTO63_37410 [Anaerolineae bacterium]|nr:hypothetical protein [Anaerolineae bacterium]NIO00442.1 hypothetical protein [Anaerolineae bacterium]NIQ83202.1 hypothetical protein [Anaerolineae bacterium]